MAAVDGGGWRRMVSVWWRCGGGAVAVWWRCDEQSGEHSTGHSVRTYMLTNFSSMIRLLWISKRIMKHETLWLRPHTPLAPHTNGTKACALQMTIRTMYARRPEVVIGMRGSLWRTRRSTNRGGT